MPKHAHICPECYTQYHSDTEYRNNALLLATYNCHLEQEPCPRISYQYTSCSRHKQDPSADVTNLVTSFLENIEHNIPFKEPRSLELKYKPYKALAPFRRQKRESLLKDRNKSSYRRKQGKVINRSTRNKTSKDPIIIGPVIILTFQGEKP